MQQVLLQWHDLHHAFCRYHSWMRHTLPLCWQAICYCYMVERDLNTRLGTKQD